MTCTEAERLIVHEAGGTAISRDLESHVAGCAACRQALIDQREVASVLRVLQDTRVPEGFAARVSQRLDALSGPAGRGARAIEPARFETGASDFLELVNWRAWTVGLAPIAAGLLLGVYLGVGAGSSTAADTTTADVQTVETMASSSSASEPAAALLDEAVSGDALVEAVLTGTVPSGTTSRGSDVR